MVEKDSNQIWNSNEPNFTVCFQESVLVWFPCLLLWVLSFYELHRIFQITKNPIPWNVLNITKIVSQMSFQ